MGVARGCQADLGLILPPLGATMTIGSNGASDRYCVHQRDGLSVNNATAIAGICINMNYESQHDTLGACGFSHLLII